MIQSVLSNVTSKMKSISVPNAREVVHPYTGVRLVLAGEIVLVGLADGGPSVVQLGVLIAKVEVPLFLSDVAHVVVLPVDVAREPWLGGSEDIVVVVYN